MRILVLTSVYKDLSLGNRDTSTNIVNSFVSDWIKQKHEVIVIHNSHCYPILVHIIPNRLKKKLANMMGFSIADYDAVRKKEYNDSGAMIYRLPIKKYLPHKAPSENEIIRQSDKIVEILKKESFEPDIITGHWASPQMEIISRLKKIYNCKTTVILHGTGYINSPDFNVQKYLKNIDHLGARSLSQARRIQKLLNLNEPPFVCNSGVPDSYLENYELKTEKFKGIRKWKFTYVGRLVAYKNIDSVIKALSKLTDIDWELNIVGDGGERNSLEKLAKNVHCEDKVIFWGHIPRDQVMELLSDTHVFVMVSTNEIFGLVYLEAMAASCITIASKNGGVDGIIVDGQNGFLCEQGNVDELVIVLNSIMAMKMDELMNIARKGYITANNCSDSKMAIDYLNNILS